MHEFIGAGSRGGSCPPGNILPLWELYFEPNKRSPRSANTFFLENTYFWDKKAAQIRKRLFFFREHLLLGQNSGPDPTKTLFLENAYFWDRNAVQIWRRPFFLLLENTYFWDKNAVQIPSIW